LNEFASVARRKLRMSWKDVNAAVDSFGVLCPSPVPITIDTLQSALKIAERYGYEIYDALIAAAALQSGSATVYSEDLQDGQVIEGRLAIRNPFK
jgi:predicted nucleic acid-binding protein